MLKLNHLLPDLLVTTQGAPTQYVIWLVFSVLFLFLCSLLKVSEKGKLLASDFSEIEQQAIGHDAEESIALKRQEAILEEEAREKMYVFFMLMVNKLLRFSVA